MGPVFLFCLSSLSFGLSGFFLNASEDSHDISRSVLFMLMLIFSEDIVDISISACRLVDSFTFMPMSKWPRWITT